MPQPSSEQLARASCFGRVAMPLAVLGMPYTEKQAGAGAGAGAFQQEQLGMPSHQREAVPWAEPQAEAVTLQHEEMGMPSH